MRRSFPIPFALLPALAACGSPAGRTSAEAPPAPRIEVAAEDFDLDGVHLYPRSRIAALDITPRDVKLNSARIRFESPAPPETVRAWFREKLTRERFTLATDGNGLSGTSSEHKPFRLQLRPVGTGHAEGTISFGG